MKKLLVYLLLFTSYHLSAQNTLSEDIISHNKELPKQCRTCTKRRIRISQPAKKMIAQDLAFIKQTLNKLPELNPSLSLYAEYLPELQTRQAPQYSAINLNDDLRYITVYKNINYLNLTFRFLVYKDAVLHSQYQMTVYDGIFENHFAQVLDFPWSCAGNNVEYTRKYPKQLSRYLQKYPKFQFDLKEATLNAYTPSILTAFVNLISIENLTATFTSADILSYEFDQANLLLKAKQYPLFEKLLYGPNPIARIFAYHALTKALKEGYTASEDLKVRLAKTKKEGLLFYDRFQQYEIRGIAQEQFVIHRTHRTH